MLPAELLKSRAELIDRREARVRLALRLLDGSFIGRGGRPI
jgi:hypothetical protein